MHGFVLVRRLIGRLTDAPWIPRAFYGGSSSTSADAHGTADRKYRAATRSSTAVTSPATSQPPFIVSDFNAWLGSPPIARQRPCRRSRGYAEEVVREHRARHWELAQLPPQGQDAKAALRRSGVVIACARSEATSVSPERAAAARRVNSERGMTGRSPRGGGGSDRPGVAPHRPRSEGGFGVTRTRMVYPYGLLAGRDGPPTTPPSLVLSLESTSCGKNLFDSHVRAPHHITEQLRPKVLGFDPTAFTDDSKLVFARTPRDPVVVVVN